MKESKLIELWNRVETLGQLMQTSLKEMEHLRDLSIGTMSLVKKFPDYEKAIAELAKEMKEKQNEETKLDVE